MDGGGTCAEEALSSSLGSLADDPSLLGDLLEAFVCRLRGDPVSGERRISPLRERRTAVGLDAAPAAFVVSEGTSVMRKVWCAAVAIA
jgi:hypothetical protein